MHLPFNEANRSNKTKQTETVFAAPLKQLSETKMYAFEDSFITILLSRYLGMVSIVFLLTTITLAVIQRLRDNAELPPGPFAWPVIGNIHLLGSKPHESLTKLAKTLGDVYRLQLGSRRVVVLNSLESVKESLVKKSSDFSSRPPLSSLQACEGSLTFGPYDSMYVKKRRLAHLCMHSFMSDHERLDAQINYGLQNLCNRFANHDGEFDPINDIKHAVAEMNFNYTFGEDIDPKNKEKLCQILKEFSEFNASCLPDFLPWLAPFFQNSLKRIKEIVAHLLDFVKHIYFEKKAKFNKKADIGCVGDALVRCFESGTNERLAVLGEELDLKEEDVATLLTDLYGASVDTTSTTLIWAVLYLASNLNVQERLYKEINKVVGVNSLEMNDKHRLPFLEAVVLEVLRLSTVLPLAVPHYTNNETRVGKYRVPKDTMVFVNLWAINHDERVFNNPYQFDPCHFLDENGQVNKARFSSIPFSSGTRKCLGHLLAQLQLFLLIGGLVQKYKFEISGSSNTTPEFGFILRPQSFKINVCQRQ
ncbi:cytochrome P450 1A1-like [Xenia sp. Carnegie-2017]|uniref:cytochrome P450 1A1-like n=1 Tax=Xenia sp. Carnegie-2017 TaxID=2897299 RepID=UPI001F043E79|nr:cytochrome P450 1A1-like [Xenia sp. Carnegie-2017]